MFLSSVFVPKPVSPTGRIEMFASQRSEPCDMSTSRDPELAQRLAQQLQPLARLLGRLDVGLGDDLDERRAAAVEVDDRRVGAVDAPRLPHVDELRRVLLEVHAVDAHVAQMARPAQRFVVLADLVRLGVVGIEVVLAVEDRAVGELAVERHPDHQPVLDRLLVDHRQRAGQAEADRAAVRVRLLAEGQRARAEHLRPRVELDVDLQADDGLEVGHDRARRSVEADGLLERVGRVEDPVLAERAADDLEADGQALRSARSGSRSRAGRRAAPGPCSSR